MKRVGLFLHKPVFCHGQLYVAISRVTSRNGLRVLIAKKDYNDHFHTKNIVYKEIFGNLPRGNYCHLLYVIKSTLQLMLY